MLAVHISQSLEALQLIDAMGVQDRLDPPGSNSFADLQGIMTAEGEVDHTEFPKKKKGGGKDSDSLDAEKTLKSSVAVSHSFALPGSWQANS